jgi:exonuclease VII small subunit
MGEKLAKRGQAEI